MDKFLTTIIIVFVAMFSVVVMGLFDITNALTMILEEMCRKSSYKDRGQQMTNAEKKELLIWASGLTNEELEQEYYDASLDCLGSEAEEMYEQGWDIADIVEREKYEKYLIEKANILEILCLERGIELYPEH